MSHSKDNAIGRKQTVDFLIETWGKPQLKMTRIQVVPPRATQMKMGTELPPFDFFLFLRMKSQLLGCHFQDVPEIHKEMRKQYKKVTLDYTRNARSIA